MTNVEWKKVGRNTWNLVGENEKVLAKITQLNGDLQWKMAYPDIWHLVDKDDKVLVKVSRESFKDNGNWVRWSVHNFSCSNHKLIREAAEEAEQAFL